MTRAEFAGLFKKLQHAYSFLRYDSTDMIDTWYELLKDAAYGEMAAAVQDWMTTQPKDRHRPHCSSTRSTTVRSG